MNARYLGILVSAVLMLGCVHKGTVVQSDEGLDFGRYHKIGVMPFSDRRGHGAAIAKGIEAGLRKLQYDIADAQQLDKILAHHRPDPFYGIDLETLNSIRSQTSADAIIIGVVAPDYHQANFSFIDTESGDPVLRATLKPRGDKKVFSDPQELIIEALHVFDAPPGTGTAKDQFDQ